jgi:antitoxin ParD1/3/4
MSISLKPEQEQFVQERLKSGKYQSVDEVLLEAFRLLEERDRLYGHWVEQTRKEAAVGLAELNQGEGLDGETVIAQLQEKLRQAHESE